MKTKRTRLAALLFLTACCVPVQAASPGNDSDAKHAIKLFHDYCLVLRSKPDEFSKALDRVGTRLKGDEDRQFGIGEMGDSWRTLDGNYVFFRNEYSRCRMYILPRQITGVLGEFGRMADNPPRGMTSREILPDKQQKFVSFVWSGDGALIPTDMVIYPSMDKGSHWTLSATDYRDEPAPIIWDQIGPGIDISKMPPARSRSANIAIYPLDGNMELTSWIETNKINQQTDGYGDVWTFDPRKPDKGWSRLGKVVSKDGSTEVYAFLAGYTLTNYLNYKAATQATQLALSRLGKDQEPRTDPASSAPLPRRKTGPGG
ncbi:hypothetical protein [Lysobacter sp. CA196]|uniref:hypothetical protein n=1 Tax=Lysobacter sp. CA196 TaxID=3455606 RepID=UPI003F8D0FC3